MPEDRLYFRQLLAGRDFARDNMIARQMVNFAYLIGDRETGEALLIDPAYSTSDLLDILATDGMSPVGVLGTHYHADHVGGDLMGHPIEGISALLEQVDIPIHLQRAETPWVERTTGVTDALVAHDPGDIVTVGSIEVTLVHTPGHTPGSQCFLVDGCLVSGDTLFLEGCGRTDLPGSDPVQMYETLTQRLSRIPDETILYPGHLYSAEPSQSMGETRKDNWVLAPRSAEEWLAIFG
jgi:glyoxylase-like metal-dependent hydrolase (beta-lactamase superfamily II)